MKDNEGQKMVGERPSKSAPNINYESQMRGEHGKKMKGPDAMESGPKAAKPVKLAMGGVGKIRKGEMSASGMPTKQRRGK